MQKWDMAEIIEVNAGLLPPMNVTFPVQEDPSAAASATSAAAAPAAPLSSEDYLFVESRHPNTVLQGLNSLRLNNAFCDVTLCCGGQEFPCHRIVLASFSSYFQVNPKVIPVTMDAGVRGDETNLCRIYMKTRNFKNMSDFIERVYKVSSNVTTNTF